MICTSEYGRCFRGRPRVLPPAPGVITIMSRRAFDTSKLGAGYGFESFPQQRLEMPPTWAILVALTFLVGALLFWVIANVVLAIAMGTDIYRFT